MISEQNSPKMMSRLEKAGLTGCFNDTEINSTNYKELMNWRAFENRTNGDLKMSEWKPFDTAPKDRRAILATDGSEVLSIEWINDEKGYWSIVDGCGIHYNLTHWMEAPELPVKRHECKGGSYDTVTCHQEQGELYMHVRGRAEIHHVLYCPFCGEKA